MLSAKVSPQPNIDDFCARHWLGLCDLLHDTVMLTLSYIKVGGSSDDFPFNSGSIFTACCHACPFSRSSLWSKNIDPTFWDRRSVAIIYVFLLGYRYLTLTLGLQLVGFSNCSSFKILLEVCLNIWSYGASFHPWITHHVAYISVTYVYWGKGYSQAHPSSIFPMTFSDPLVPFTIFHLQLHAVE